MFSPRLHAWIVSPVPIAARSPSPWYVKTELRRIQPFDRRSYRRRAPVRRLHPIDIDVVVRQHRAAHRRNADRVVLDLHFIDHFGDQFVDRSVAAPRTEVHHGIGQQPGLRIDPVFRDQFYFRFSHKLYFNEKFFSAPPAPRSANAPRRPCARKWNTGTRHRAANCTSSIICPVLISTDRKPLTRSDSSSIAPVGNG